MKLGPPCAAMFIAWTACRPCSRNQQQTSPSIRLVAVVNGSHSIESELSSVRRLLRFSLPNYRSWNRRTDSIVMFRRAQRSSLQVLLTTCCRMYELRKNNLRLVQGCPA